MKALKHAKLEFIEEHLNRMTDSIILMFKMLIANRWYYREFSTKIGPIRLSIVTRTPPSLFLNDDVHIWHSSCLWWVHYNECFVSVRGMILGSKFKVNLLTSNAYASFRFVIGRVHILAHSLPIVCRCQRRFQIAATMLESMVKIKYIQIIHKEITCLMKGVYIERNGFGLLKWPLIQ